MNCPKCDGKTNSLNFEADLQVERCESCKGVWMDKGELARYANLPEDLPIGTYGTGKATTFSCPACKLKNEKQPLYQTAFAQDLSLDYCQTCHGLWFDNKEISALQNHLKNLRIQAKLNKKK
jgi:Zn-finger nucleic acid-binding protein